jgi:peptidoglycan/xylan/chitin deacetylase (PgdA/CDA1 family)
MLIDTIDNLRGKALDLFRRTGAGAMVLLYHRVAELDRDPQLLSVSPERFDEQMRMIARAYQPISLRYLASCVRHGGIPSRAVVVTFDDGYEDNLTFAKPILERYKVPATVFVASGVVDSDREFYWDKLEDIFLSDRALPHRLDITIGSKVMGWDFNGETSGCGDTSWNALMPAVTQRQAAYLSLCDMLRPLPANQQQSLIDELCRWANISASARPTHRAMTAEQVCLLAEGGLIEIGAHTVDHPILATLTPGEQRRQVLESKLELERMIDQPVLSFSYPYGTRSSYTPETEAAVRSAEYECACSNFPGTANRGTDPLQLPRVLVRDWAGDRMLQEIGRAAA